MDFIDDFIQEYKNNPCLWKTDSIHFKNRSKRQEAYIKLIEVAAKHGEHYNIERTKQKINNLRCAFRHQLKKYAEFKNRGEKDEPYCPKRRYFESLMFLKDEECLDRKHKRGSLPNTEILKEKQEEISEINSFHDAIGFNKDHEPKNTIVISEDIHSKILGENSGPNLNSYTPFKSPVITSESVEYDEEKSSNFVQESIELESMVETEHVDTQIYDYEREPSVRMRKVNKHRKRSSSVSSQLTNDTEVIGTKTPRKDFSSMDFEKLCSLMCKSVHSNMDDSFSNFGKLVAHKLRSMDPMQAIYSEKIIADVLFQGQVKLLSASSIKGVLSTEYSSNSYGDLNSCK